MKPNESHELPVDGSPAFVRDESLQIIKDPRFSDVDLDGVGFRSGDEGQPPRDCVAGPFLVVSIRKGPRVQKSRDDLAMPIGRVFLRNELKLAQIMHAVSPWIDLEDTVRLDPSLDDYVGIDDAVPLDMRAGHYRDLNGDPDMVLQDDRHHKNPLPPSDSTLAGIGPLFTAANRWRHVMARGLVYGGLSASDLPAEVTPIGLDRAPILR